MLSALLVTWRLSGSAGVRSFLQRGFRGLGWGWFLFSLLSPLLFLVPAAVVAATRGTAVSYLRGLGLVFAWLYNVTRGNILAVVMAAAVVIAIVYRGRPARESARERITA